MNTNKTKKVLKFSASWCAPCRMYASTFKTASEMEDFKDITFETIDIDKKDDSETALMLEKFSIKSVPTTILFDENDNPIYKLMGNIPLKDLVDIINSTLKDKEEEEKEE